MSDLYRDGERPYWHIYNFLRGLDMFGQEVPGFRIKGQRSVNTVLGGLLTGTALLITLVFAGHKWIQLWNRQNPVMSELTQKDHIGPLDKIYYNDIDFRMAFSLEGYFDNERKDDERYVRWIARTWYTDDNGVEGEIMHNMHLCTEKDLKEFYPVSAGSKEAYEKIINDPKRGLFCIDWTDDMYI